MRPSSPSTDLRGAPPAPRPRTPAGRLRASQSSRGAGLGDEGNAALEFILAGLILLVPTVYLIVTLGLVQEQTLGAQAGARHVARAVATSTDPAAAGAAADAVLASIADEYGMDPDAVAVSTSCLPAGAACPQAGATLLVTVSTRIALPLVPSFLGLDRFASIPVEATSAQKVSRFWEDG